MRTVVVLFGTSIAALGCGVIKPPPPPPADLPATFAVDQDIGEAWQGTVDFLFDLGVELQLSDREGGILSVGWTEIRDEPYADRIMMCGTAWGNRITAGQQTVPWFRLQVQMTEVESGGTLLRINPTYEHWFRNLASPLEPNTYDPFPCTTTGVLERELVAQIKSR